VEYLNLHASVLDNEILATADDGPRSTWLHLMRFCIGQENGGRIAGAKDWSERKWLLTCRILPVATQAVTALWTWEGPDLVLWGYPMEKQREVRAKRKAARDTNRKRWASVSLSDTSSDSDNDTPSDSPSDSGMEGKGMEGNIGKEGKGSTPILSDVLAYALEIGLSANEAEKFFDHYEANGWRQSNRTRIRSWHAALRNWQRRGREFGKNSDDGAAPGTIAFLPKGPNPHTGGAAEVR
jgi:hypothetical protein